MSSASSPVPSPHESNLVQQLRQSLGMLQVAFDAASEAMLIVDVDRKVHWANQASAELLVGGVPIQVVNRTLADLMEVQALDSHALAARGLLDPGQSLPRSAGESRCHLLLPGGKSSPVQLLRWRPVELIQAPCVLMTIRDLSPEERALVQQQRFMTSLTHELRTPLAIVSGNLQRMARLSPLSDAISKRLTMAREEMVRIQRLLENLTLLTRLEVDPDVLACSDQPVLPLLQQWCHLSGERSAALEFLWGNTIDSAVVHIDPGALMLALDHLLDNALQHGEADKPLKLQVLPLDGSGYCTLELSSCSDDAIVDPDVIEAWLSPFTKGGLQRDGEQVEGPGLGLSVARQLTLGWGGDLAVNQHPSESGTETVVRISLPLSAQESSSTAPAAAQTDPA